MANGSTNGHRNQSKAVKHEMSLRQAAQGKRKGSLDIFKGKKGLTVLLCRFGNHVINWPNKIDLLRMNSFCFLNHVNKSH